MSRKHYIQFANMFKSVLETEIINSEVSKLDVILIIKGSMRIFKLDNPLFDPHKFWNACGLKDYYKHN